MIRHVSDLQFVETPYQVSAWTREGRRLETHHQPRAILFARGDTPPDKTPWVVVVQAMAYGDPFVSVGQLQDLYVGPDAQHPTGIHLRILLRRKRPRARRESAGYVHPWSDEFTHPVLIAWGSEPIALPDGPRPGPTILWRDADCFAATWRAVQAAAVGRDVLLDNIDDAITYIARRRQEDRERRAREGLA